MFSKSLFLCKKKIHVCRQIFQCFQQKFWFLSKVYFSTFWLCGTIKRKKIFKQFCLCWVKHKSILLSYHFEGSLLAALYIVLGFEFAFVSPSPSIFRTHIMVILNHVFPAFTLKCMLDVKTNSYISAMYYAIAELTTFLFNDKAQGELNVSENKVREKKNSLFSIVFTLILSSNKKNSIYHHLI